MVKDVKYISQSEEETIKCAQKFADSLQNGDIILLHGTLGMGKSVFSRATIRHLFDDPSLEVPSPTFTLVQTYDSPRATIWHFDLYRLSDVSEIYEIGWEEALSNGIILVEWPERLGSMIPKTYYDVTISAKKTEPNYREIEIKYHG